MTQTNDEILDVIIAIENAGAWFHVPQNNALWNDPPTDNGAPFKAAAMLRQWIAERKEASNDTQ
jgi:hypothetical protein